MTGGDSGKVPEKSFFILKCYVFVYNGETSNTEEKSSLYTDVPHVRNEQGSFINADGDTEDDALWKIIYILRTNKKCLRPPRVRKNLWHPVYNCVDQFGEPIGLKICSS